MTNTNAVLFTLAQNKDAIASLGSIVTMLGIIVGGLWVYLVFVRQRQKYPRAKVLHSIKIMPISDSKCFLRLTITVENTGDVLIAPDMLKVGIHQIRPWPPPITGWDPLCTRPLNATNGEYEFDYLVKDEIKLAPAELQIEPHESDETNVDVVLPTSAQTISCYSYVRNTSKKRRVFRKSSEIGWHTTTLHDLKPAEAPTKQIGRAHV